MKSLPLLTILFFSFPASAIEHTHNGWEICAQKQLRELSGKIEQLSVKKK